MQPVSGSCAHALTLLRGPQLGGEIQLWQALAYQACGREEECLEVYRGLEKTHPVPSIRKQARL